MIKNHVKIAIFIVLLCSIFSFLPNNSTLVKAGSGFFNEDFSTTTYLDAINTNATGWGSGLVKTPYKDTLELKSIYNNSNDPVDVFVKGDYAYTADYHGDLSILDISDSSNPISISNYTLGSGAATPTGVFVVNDICYVTTRQWGLQIVNITNPAAPTNLSAYYTIDLPRDLFVLGDYCYIADEAGGVQIVNISNPSNPTNVTAIDIGTGSASRAYGVYVEGNMLYAVDYFSRFVVYDVSTPSAPVHQGNISLASNAYDLSVDGNTAYVADGWGGFITIDVTNPAALVILDTYFTGDYFKDAKFENNLVYATESNLGVLVFDVTDPTNIILVGSYDTYNWPEGLFVRDRMVYVSDYFGGLLILDYRGYKTPIFVQSTSIASMSDDAQFVSASLTLTSWSTLWSGMAIVLYLSADGGTNWEQVVNSVTTPLTNPGADLRFRLILVCNNLVNATWVSELEISYTTKLNSVGKSSPSHLSGTNDNTTTLTWFSLTGAASYWLQVDSAGTWVSPEINVTLSGSATEYTTPALLDGLYNWRIAGIDSEGDLGSWSTEWIFVIDTIKPNVTGPDDFTYSEGDTGYNITFAYTEINPSTVTIYLDYAPIDPGLITFGANHFNVSADGLSAGSHNFTCVLSDVAGNTGSYTVMVTVTPVIEEYSLIMIVLPILMIVGTTMISISKRRK
jgi:hypothetical protein